MSVDVSVGNANIQQNKLINSQVFQPVDDWISSATVNFGENCYFLLINKIVLSIATNKYKHQGKYCLKNMLVFQNKRGLIQRSIVSVNWYISL